MIVTKVFSISCIKLSLYPMPFIINAQYKFACNILLYTWVELEWISLSLTSHLISSHSHSDWFKAQCFGWTDFGNIKGAAFTFFSLASCSKAACCSKFTSRRDMPSSKPEHVLSPRERGSKAVRLPTVSYTHLTLPTFYSASISVVAVLLNNSSIWIQQ